MIKTEHQNDQSKNKKMIEIQQIPTRRQLINIENYKRKTKKIMNNKTI